MKLHVAWIWSVIVEIIEELSKHCGMLFDATYIYPHVSYYVFNSFNFKALGLKAIEGNIVGHIVGNIINEIEMSLGQ